MAEFLLKDESKPRVLAPEGTYPGVCVDFVQRGFENTNFGVKDRCQFVFETPHTNPEYGDRLTINSRPFNITFGKKSSLRAFLEQWRGRKYGDDVAKQGVDAEKCIGLSCLLVVSHNEHDGKTYANIEAITPLPEGLAPIEPSGAYERVMSRDEGWDVRSPNSKASENPPPVQDYAQQGAAPSGGDGSPAEAVFPDDDLPF